MAKHELADGDVIDRHKLRRVQFSVVDHFGRPEGRPSTGQFHKWAERFDPADGGYKYTVAIVEDATGVVREVELKQLRFLR